MSLGENNIRFCKHCGIQIPAKSKSGRFKYYCNDSCRSRYYQGLRAKRIADDPEGFIMKELQKPQEMKELPRGCLDKIEIMKVMLNPFTTIQINPMHNQLLKRLNLRTNDVVKITVEVVLRSPKDTESK